MRWAEGEKKRQRKKELQQPSRRAEREERYAGMAAGQWCTEEEGEGRAERQQRSVVLLSFNNTIVITTLPLHPSSAPPHTDQRALLPASPGITITIIMQL